MRLLRALRALAFTLLTLALELAAVPAVHAQRGDHVVAHHGRGHRGVPRVRVHIRHPRVRHHAGVIRIAPPSPRVEVRPPPPFEGAVWTDGYWRWDSGTHVWVAGRWVHPRPGHRWSPFRWEERHGVWVLIPGGWIVVHG